MYVTPLTDLNEDERAAYGITREFRDKINEIIAAINDLETRLQALENPWN